MKFVVLGLAAAALYAGELPTCDLMGGWTQKGEARSYDAGNLFEYMDGNAEGYLLYGFVRMHGVTCVKGGDSILIDISELEDADLAFGIFSANRDPRLALDKIGAAGQVTPRRAIFAKDHYYVELAASTPQDAALREFAAALDQRLPGNSTPPAALSWFPAEGLTSVRLIPESVLGVRLLKRGYVAVYDFGKAFVVKESSEEAAAAVMDKLRARFPEASDRYLGRLGFVRKGRMIAGYANVTEGHDPAALAAALVERLP